MSIFKKSLVFVFILSLIITSFSFVNKVEAAAASVKINAVAGSGDSVVLTAVPTNGGTIPTYQWKKNGVNIPGATGATYTYPEAVGDTISVVMTSSATGVTGNPATTTIEPPLPQTVVPNITNIETFSGKVNVQWSWVQGYGQSLPVRYQIRYKKTSDSSWTVLPDVITGGFNGKDISGLTNDVSYDFQVRVINLLTKKSGGPGWVANIVSATPTKYATLLIKTDGQVCPGATQGYVKIDPVVKNAKGSSTQSGVNNATWWVNNVKQPDNSSWDNKSFSVGDVVKITMNTNNGDATDTKTITNIHKYTPRVDLSYSYDARSSNGSVVYKAHPSYVFGGNPTYQWKKNGAIVQGATGLTYTFTPSQGDYVEVVMSISDSCSRIATASAKSYPKISTPCSDVSAIDHGGQVYNTVQIGTQCWLRENMNVGNRVSSMTDQKNNNVIEKYCYGNLDSMCEIFGGLYQWAEAVQYKNGATNTKDWIPAPTGPAQGICPVGWHVPTNQDYLTLTNSLGGAGTDFNDPNAAGGKMKEQGLNNWSSPNKYGTNSSGFTALGSGSYSGINRAFGNLFGYGNFWTTDTVLYPSYKDTSKFGFSPGYNTAGIFRGDMLKTSGLAIRCLKDTTSSQNQTASVSITSTPSPLIPGQATFTATPTNGGTTPTYQWKKNGTNIQGATSATYTGTVAGGDAISVVMTSSQASVTGSPATSNVITVQAQATTPGAPTNLKLNPVLNTDGSYNLNKVNLTWDAPANNGGSPITGYEIEYRIKSTTNWTTTTSTTTTKTIDVTAGVEYEFVVNAVNALGTGDSGPMVTSPAKMTGVTVTPNGPGKLLVSWTTPNNGGSPLIQYRLRYKATDVTPLPNNWGTLMTITDPTATQAQITGLTTGKSYQVRIRAINGIFGPWSDDTTAVQVSSIDSQSLFGNSLAGFDSLTQGEISKATPVEFTDTLTTNLSYGKKHNQVKQLQSFLKAKGYLSIQTETNYFGQATKQALIKFQQDNNITPASGNLGIKTRALINEMINGGM